MPMAAESNAAEPSMESTLAHPEWPPLPLAPWQDTLVALHRWLQVVGKLRLACMPWTNHSWHVTLYPTVRGLGTSTLSCGTRTLQVDFDFIAHQLLVQTSEGRTEQLPLKPQSVAEFYRGLRDALQSLGVEVAIHPIPNEVPDPIPFAQDTAPRPYDADSVRRFWLVLLQVERVMRYFRARFRGKCSPVHFFWGAPDLALTRFSGRAAPAHPGGVPNLPDWVTREAYSHEVSSCGFWPGGGAIDYPAFYAYAYPEPDAFSYWKVQPEGAFYSRELREFILPYDLVRTATDPDATLLAFFQSTYEAAAELGRWDRDALECTLPG
jgi:hypothetical protein